jgi:hypothetical protein
MVILIESRRKRRTTLDRSWPGCHILDVTSKGEQPWIRLSPFYPHGGIPLPGSSTEFAESVEGLWQGLKVFEHEDIDPSRWRITNLQNIKRAGRMLGHRSAIDRDELLGYRDARVRLYLPAYRWVLKNRLKVEIDRIHELSTTAPIVLLDYETNGDIDDLSSPLSHAALIRRYIDGNWPNPEGG